MDPETLPWTSTDLRLVIAEYSAGSVPVSASDCTTSISSADRELQLAGSVPVMVPSKCISRRLCRADSSLGRVILWPKGALLWRLGTQGAM